MENLGTLKKNFVKIILQNSNRELFGRRYTLDEKLLCMSPIHKKSSATYKYLCTFLPLPSPSSLKIILRKIKLDIDLSQTMKDLLRDTAQRMRNEQDKVCVLMWDEVSLKLHVEYHPEKDKVIGFED